MPTIDRKISDLDLLSSSNLSLSDEFIFRDVSETTTRKVKRTTGQSLSEKIADGILKNTFNPIINGDMLLWQRGTSFSSIANYTYTADRWVYLKSGAAVHTVSQSTDVPTVAEAGRQLKYSLKVDCTTADSSIAASDAVSIDTRIEGYNFEKIAQQAFTLSFWVKAPITGTFCVGFLNSGGDRCYIAEYTINAANTWEYKEIAVLASPSGGTWDYTTGIGLSVRFSLAAGTDYQSTAGSWLSSSNKFATANQVNAVGNTSYDFYLAGVSINLGNKAITPIPRSIQEEIDLCVRYYCKSFALTVTPAQNIGATHNGNAATGIVTIAGANTNRLGQGFFPKEMRAAPTMVGFSPSSASAEAYDATASAICSSSSFSTVSTRGFIFNAVGNASSAIGNRVIWNWTAEAEL